MEGLRVVLSHVSLMFLGYHNCFKFFPSASLPVKCCIVRHNEGHIYDSCKYDAVPHLPECSIVKDQTGALKKAIVYG